MFAPTYASRAFTVLNVVVVLLSAEAITRNARNEPTSGAATRADATPRPAARRAAAGGRDRRMARSAARSLASNHRCRDGECTPPGAGAASAPAPSADAPSPNAPRAAGGAAATARLALGVPSVNWVVVMATLPVANSGTSR